MNFYCWKLGLQIACISVIRHFKAMSKQRTSVSVHVTGQSALVWTACVALGTAVSLSLQVNHPSVAFQARLELELLLALDALKVSTLKNKIQN
jgi:hypothetical protein